MIPATWGDDGWPVFGDNNQVSASDTYDKLIDLPADLENLVRQRSLVNSDDFDNDAPHQSYQDQDWWTLEEPPQVDDSLIGIELVDNGDFENGTESWTPQWNGTLTAITDGSLSGTTSSCCDESWRIQWRWPGSIYGWKIAAGRDISCQCNDSIRP